MQLTVFFVMVASIAVVDCAKLLIGVIKEPENFNNDQWPKNDEDVLQIIKSVICHYGVQIDIFSIIPNEEIIQRFDDKSIQEIKQLFCYEDSSIHDSTEFADADSITNDLRLIHPDDIVAPRTTTDITPLYVTCQKPFWDPEKCDILCFMIKKLTFLNCFKNYIKRHVIEFLEYDSSSSKNTINDHVDAIN